MKQILTILFINLFFTFQLSAQHIVRGKVSDEDGFGVPGATVVEVDKNDRIVKGTTSDFDGNYIMQVSSPTVTVKYSFIGFKTVIEEINGRSEVNVTLQSDSKSIEEIVVKGEVSSSSITGISEKDKTGASVSFEMSEMQGASVTSVGDVLQGQVAGLDIMGGGSPGSGSSIVIRGLGTLGNNTPLIVVDGIEQKLSIGDFDFGSADTEDIGQLVSIAPEDIKSIRVLKDAAETAIWGSKGANGVLEIETLRGQKGKTRFDVTYKKSLSIQPPTIPLLNGDEYVQLQQELWHNAYGIFELPPEIANDRDFYDYFNYAQNTNWVDEVSRVGQIDDFGFKIMGGGDKTNYFASVNYQNNIGNTINTANKRITTRINLDYRISNNLTLNTGINYVNIYKDDNYYNIRNMAYRKAPNMAIFEYDSEGNQTEEYFNPTESYQGNGISNYNPVAVGHLSDNDIAENNFQTQFDLRYRPTDWLLISETVSFQYKNKKVSRFLPYTAIGARWLDAQNNQGYEQNSSGTLLTTRFRALITALNSDNHYLSGVFLWETNQNTDEFIATSTGNGTSVIITDPAAGGAINSISSNAYEVNSVGALSTLLYKFKDKYILQSNLRLDANSKFGESSRWGFFPSISAAWIFSDEFFVKNIGYVSEGKLRFSYGRTGSEFKSAYDRHGIYNGIGTFMDLATLIPTQVELERLRWQTVDMLNIGIDLGLFRDKVYINAEFYDKQTTDVLWGDNDKYQLPSSSGYSNLKQFNDGGLRNVGWEFNTNVEAFRDNNWTIKLNFNVYNNTNYWTQFPQNLITEKNLELGNGNYPVKAEVGKPVGSFFGFSYKGVYATNADAVARYEDGSAKIGSNGQPIAMNYNGEYQFEGGDAIYEDINYDGIIDLNDVVYLGDSNPDFAGGFGTSIKYKQFALSAQFLYRTGFQIVNGIALQTESMLNRNNQSKAVLKRWRRPGQDFEGILPRAYLGHPANNLGSDRYVENGDFVRLNNLSFNYSFGKKALEKLHLRNLKVGFVGRKLYTLTNYSGQDPEVKVVMSDPFWFGTDNGRSPSPSVYAINVIVGF